MRAQQCSRDEPDGVNIADTRKHHFRSTRDTVMDTQTSLHPPRRVSSLCAESTRPSRTTPLFRCSHRATRNARALRLNPLTTTPPVGPGYNNSYFTALESPPLRNTDHNGARYICYCALEKPPPLNRTGISIIIYNPITGEPSI